MTVSTWSMFIKTDNNWKAVRAATDGLEYGSPYEYPTEQDALTELALCYPDEVRAQRLGGSRTHEVAPTDWDGTEADKLRYR